MADWVWAIAIIVFAILIAIILSKRGWARHKKSPIKHYKKSRDKLSGVDNDGTNPITIIVVIILGAGFIFGLYELVKWLFTTVMTNTNLTNTTSTNTFVGGIETASGTLGIPSGVLKVVIIAVFILLIMYALGGRRFMRNHGTLLFIAALPFLYLFGMPINVMVIAVLFIIPIIVWRAFTRVARFD